MRKRRKRKWRVDIIYRNSGSLPKIFLKAKSTKGSMYFPVTGGLVLGIDKYKMFD
jgi:hypothetical protein